MLACPIYFQKGAVGGRVMRADTLFTPAFQHSLSRLEESACACA